jgi:drug/metabolite transporter (DMT)-like permease
MDRRSDRFWGLALVTGAAVLWSTAGLFVRLLDLDNWTIQSWRSLFGALSLLAIIAGQHGRRTPDAFRSIGWPGLAAVPTGGRRIPAGEAGLIGLLDVVLGPLWVWLAFGETPSRAAFIGGGLVLGAVVWFLSDGLARPHRAQ